jgi:hypothetical protein
VAQPPLRFLHPQTSLVPSKLQQFRLLATDEILRSLLPGNRGALKARPDGTILDGHHRVEVLRERGFDIDALPREVIEREPNESS